MNEEELKEALKIIKEPITVNSVNYKYFDEINYDKLIMVYDNCLWFANNLEQLASNLEQLQQKNQQLKSQLQQRDNIINKADKKIEKMFEIGDENKVIDDLLELQEILNIDKGDEL